MISTGSQPFRLRKLERLGQLRLDWAPAPRKVSEIMKPESFEDALEQTFPERQLTERELFEEFSRLFPAEV